MNAPPPDWSLKQFWNRDGIKMAQKPKLTSFDKSLTPMLYGNNGRQSSQKKGSSRINVLSTKGLYDDDDSEMSNYN